MRLEEAIQLSEAHRESEDALDVVLAVDILRDAIETARQLYFWLQAAVNMNEHDARTHAHKHTAYTAIHRYIALLFPAHYFTAPRQPNSELSQSLRKAELILETLNASQKLEFALTAWELWLQEAMFQLH